ncbi:MAG: type II toxin-antitoxin system VapC family toxin [Planctomycetota bacterium]
MKPYRVYVDTSVFGGCFDEEFSVESLHFFDDARNGRLLLLISDVVINELAKAPETVRAIVTNLPPEVFEILPITGEVESLRDAYIAAGVVSSRSLDDATHVAAATVGRADAIVSWNFRHIVHLDKIKGYQMVNLTNGYGILTILSPAAVISNESNN